MAGFEEKSYKAFEMFHKQWALVTAGDMGRFNSCTIGWGSIGTLWAGVIKGGAIVTVYLYPTRYTCDFLIENETFAVSFFPESCKKALGVMGSCSGRDVDKVAASGLTPVPAGDTVSYEEAELTFVCRKIYQHQLAKEDIAADVREYYESNERVFPKDENGEWQPHWVFIGEVTEVIEKQ